MSIKVEIIPLERVTAKDLSVIYRGAVAGDLDEEELKGNFLAGRFIIFRITSEEEHGILLVTETEVQGKREWCYELLATSGKTQNIVLKYNQELSDILEDFARSQGVSRLWAMQVPKLWKYITEPVGWKIRRYEVEKEL